VLLAFTLDLQGLGLWLGLALASSRSPPADLALDPRRRLGLVPLAPWRTAAALPPA
jgi:hypothetical protein